MKLGSDTRADARTYKLQTISESYIDLTTSGLDKVSIAAHFSSLGHIHRVFRCVQLHPHRKRQTCVLFSSSQERVSLRYQFLICHEEDTAY